MSSCARWEQLESCRSDGIRPHTAVYAKRDALASRKIATYRVHGRSCGRGIAATAWLWSVCELGTAWGEENRVEKATTRVVQRPFLARNDKKAVQLLHTESGAAAVPVVAASGWHRCHRMAMVSMRAGDGVG